MNVTYFSIFLILTYLCLYIWCFLQAVCYWILHFILFASEWLLIWCLDHLYPIWLLICALKKKQLSPICSHYAFLLFLSFFYDCIFILPPYFFFYLLDVTLLLLVSAIALGSMVCMSSLPQSTFKQYYATLCAVYDYCKQIFSFPSESHSIMSDSLPPHELYSPWNSPGQNAGVAIPFSRVSSQPRDWTQVSLIAREFFTS